MEGDTLVAPGSMDVQPRGHMADNQEHLVDKRTVRRNIQKGLLRREDYQAYLKNLPDKEGNAETIDLRMEADESADEAERGTPPAADLGSND